MNRMTLDELIVELQKQKEAGVDGSTVVALAGTDNNARGGYVNFEVKPKLVSVAKADFEKDWTIAKCVSQRGVRVLVLG